MQLAITNLSPDQLVLPYLEKVVKPGATITLDVAQSELCKMADLQEAVADGLAEYQVTPTAIELASGMLTKDIPVATSAGDGLQTAQGKRIEQQNYEACLYLVQNTATWDPTNFVAADVGATAVVAGNRILCPGGVQGIYVATSPTAAAISNTGADSVRKNARVNVGSDTWIQTGTVTAAFAPTEKGGVYFQSDNAPLAIGSGVATLITIPIATNTKNVVDITWDAYDGLGNIVSGTQSVTVNRGSGSPSIPAGGNVVGSDFVDMTTAFATPWAPTAEISGNNLIVKLTASNASSVIPAVSALLHSRGYTPVAVPTENLFNGAVLGGSENSYASPLTGGLVFQCSVAAEVTAAWLYKGTNQTGTHIGALYTTGGSLLAQVTFIGEPTTGLPQWTRMAFATPVAITPNTNYILAIYMPNGGQWADTAFNPSGVTRGHLTAPSDLVTPNNLFHLGSNLTFPTSDSGGVNMGIDVEVQITS